MRELVELNGLELLRVIFDGASISAPLADHDRAYEAIGVLKGRLESLQGDYAARRDMDRAIRDLVVRPE